MSPNSRPDVPDPASMAAADRIVQPLQLWLAVDKLTNPTRRRIYRDTGRMTYSELVNIPSLWDQLVEAVGSGAGGKARGVQRSKPPCDASALSLTVEIADAVRAGCVGLRIKPRGDVPRDLRSAVSGTIRLQDDEANARLLSVLRGWVARIKTAVRNDPDAPWRMHGAACRVCQSTSVQSWDDDGEETRIPALVVHSRGGVIDSVSCDFCGSKLVGQDLARIVSDTLRRRAS